MATLPPRPPTSRPSGAVAAGTAAAPSSAANGKRPLGTPSPAGMQSSGSFAADQLSPDATTFPPIYEAAILYAADRYEASEEVLKIHLKTNEGKASIRTWLMLFDFYQLTHNRKEFDALSILFTVKFERSPPHWIDSTDSSDPRRKEKRERKDFFPMTPASDGALLAEIDRLEAFATEMGSCRIGFELVKEIRADEAELLGLVLQRLRKQGFPMWFNALDDFASILRAGINEKNGHPLEASEGYWNLLFELFSLDGRLQEYEDLGLEYAMAFEMSPPPWVVVTRPSGPDGVLIAPAAPPPSAKKDAGGFPLKGVISASSKDVLHQLAVYAASHTQVVVDFSGVLRIDFASVPVFFESLRAIHLTQKRVILSNLNEPVAALLEVFGFAKHAIIMRKKAT